MAARQLICLLLCLFFIATRVCAEKLPEAYKRIAQLENVPAEVLYSLALAESSYELSHGVRPWPWTINVAGKAYRYPTRWEAYQATLSFIQRYPLKRIDVGIAQINLGWNGHYFNSVWHAFDPYLNLRVAARLLYGCYQRHREVGLRLQGVITARLAVSKRSPINMPYNVICPASVNPKESFRDEACSSVFCHPAYIHSLS